MPPVIFNTINDVALWCVYGFFLFFAVLVFWLHYEGKREGYPLVRDTGRNRTDVQGFPYPPRVRKTFKVTHRDSSGGRGPVSERDTSTSLVHTDLYPQGQPLTPTGNPMEDGVGPASWVNRIDKPDMMFDTATPKILPMRALPDFEIPEECTDPRGKPCVTFDGKVAGTVVDVWIDCAEHLARYYEVETAGGAGRVMVPMGFARIDAKGTLNLASVNAEQLAATPKLKNPDQITFLEEDKVSAWFGGGQFYATPERSEPFFL